MKLGKWIDSEFNNGTMRRSGLQIATVNAFYIFALFFPGIKAWKHFTALSSAGLMAWRTEKKKNAKWAHCEKYVSADCKSKWKSWCSQQKREHFKLQTQRDKVAPFKASRFFLLPKEMPTLHCRFAAFKTYSIKEPVANSILWYTSGHSAKHFKYFSKNVCE